MDGSNYIADRNYWQLTPPPEWWLRRLGAFDPDLVVIPSREQAVFWLTRRMQFTPPFSGKSMDGYGPAPDAQMFIDHRLIDVCSLTMHLSDWHESTLVRLKAWLDARDTWKEEGGPLVGDKLTKALTDGGSTVTKRVEYEEARRRANRDSGFRDTLWHASGDAYRSLQARLGRRVMNPGLPTSTPSQAGADHVS